MWSTPSKSTKLTVTRRRFSGLTGQPACHDAPRSAAVTGATAEANGPGPGGSVVVVVLVVGDVVAVLVLVVVVRGARAGEVV